MSESLPREYRAKVLNESWTNFSVLRHRRFDGMLVTSKNSGTHWLKYMLAVALAETHGLPHPTYFSENAVRPYIGWPKDDATFAELPSLAFSHTIPHQLAEWGWARSLADLPPYVLAVRHPTIHVVQYEQTQKDPRAVLQAVSDHWSLDLPPEAIDVALAAGTKDAMAQKIDPDAEPNVLQNRKTPLTELFTGEAMDIYTSHVRTLFRHDLDYDLLTLPS